MTPPLKTRKPTGKPPWPMLLLAGMEKTGKSYACAVASASEHIGRTFWIGIGEDDPDEYGAIPGARFEIVEHDGTYWNILRAIEAAVAQPATDGKPNLIVVDSIGRLWELLADMAQAEANRRRRKDEAVITMDQWNVAKSRWAHVITALKSHNGPVVVTSRMEKVTVMDDDGNPTKEKIFKIRAEKSLPFDVGVIVKMHARGEYYLEEVRSLKFKPEPGVTVPYPDFTVEKLWTDLGVTEPGATAPRHVSQLDAEAEEPEQPQIQSAPDREPHPVGRPAAQEPQPAKTVKTAWDMARKRAWDATAFRATSQESREALWREFHAENRTPTIGDFDKQAEIWKKPAREQIAEISKAKQEVQAYEPANVDPVTEPDESYAHGGHSY